MFGAVLVFLFSSFAIKAVGRAAFAIINNVRDQFKNNPGIMQGTSKPDYGQCVDIATKSALQEMVRPGLLVVLHADRRRPRVQMALQRHWVNRSTARAAPRSSAACLMVGTIVGILMALFLNNGGGAWDNAKKYIETGAVRREAVRSAQGRGGRRHRRRSVQGHRRAVAARLDEAAEHDHAGAGAAVHLTCGRRQRQKRKARSSRQCRGERDFCSGEDCGIAAREGQQRYISPFGSRVIRS